MCSQGIELVLTTVSSTDSRQVCSRIRRSLRFTGRHPSDRQPILASRINRTHRTTRSTTIHLYPDCKSSSQNTPPKSMPRLGDRSSRYGRMPQLQRPHRSPILPGTVRRRLLTSILSHNKPLVSTRRTAPTSRRLVRNKRSRNNRGCRPILRSSTHPVRQACTMANVRPLLHP